MRNESINRSIDLHLSTLRRGFILSAGALLLGSALVRFIIFFRDSTLLHGADPLLGIPLQLGLLLLLSVELAVALVCLFANRPGLQVTLVAWLALNHLVLRIGMGYMGIHPEWTFAGMLTDPLHLGRGWTGWAVAYGLPGALLAGSLAALAGAGLQRWRGRGAAFEKMACPECGRHIRFGVEDLGRQVPCPQCKTAVTLRRPGTLKTECHFCKGHVEFPDHALGRRIDCPHCRRGILLREME